MDGYILERLEAIIYTKRMVGRIQYLFREQRRCMRAFEPEHIPGILKGEYEIIWKLDVESLLEYYKGIFNQTGIAKLTGINEKQLNHYASGLKKPRPAQAKKIEAALHRLGNELLAVEL